MTKILTIAAGLGSFIWLNTSWWMSLLIAGGTYLLTKPEDTGTKAVQTIDFATGEVKLQPMTAAAQKYLNSLND
jgi:hypothetical protein